MKMDVTDSGGTNLVSTGSVSEVAGKNESENVCSSSENLDKGTADSNEENATGNVSLLEHTTESSINKTQTGSPLSCSVSSQGEDIAERGNVVFNYKDKLIESAVIRDSPALCPLAWNETTNEREDRSCDKMETGSEEVLSLYISDESEDGETFNHREAEQEPPNKHNEVTDEGSNTILMESVGIERPVSEKWHMSQKDTRNSDQEIRSDIDLLEEKSKAYGGGIAASMEVDEKDKEEFTSTLWEKGHTSQRDAECVKFCTNEMESKTHTIEESYCQEGTSEADVEQESKTHMDEVRENQRDTDPNKISKEERENITHINDTNKNSCAASEINKQCEESELRIQGMGRNENIFCKKESSKTDLEKEVRGDDKDEARLCANMTDATEQTVDKSHDKRWKEVSVTMQEENSTLSAEMKLQSHGQKVSKKQGTKIYVSKEGMNSHINTNEEATGKQIRTRSVEVEADNSVGDDEKSTTHESTPSMVQMLTENYLEVKKKIKENLKIKVNEKQKKDTEALDTKDLMPLRAKCQKSDLEEFDNVMVDSVGTTRQVSKLKKKFIKHNIASKVALKVKIKDGNKKKSSSENVKNKAALVNEIQTEDESRLKTRSRTVRTITQNQNNKKQKAKPISPKPVVVESGEEDSPDEPDCVSPVLKRKRAAMVTVSPFVRKKPRIVDLTREDKSEIVHAKDQHKSKIAVRERVISRKVNCINKPRVPVVYGKDNHKSRMDNEKDENKSKRANVRAVKVRDENRSEIGIKKDNIVSKVINVRGKKSTTMTLRDEDKSNAKTPYSTRHVRSPEISGQECLVSQSVHQIKSSKIRVQKYPDPEKKASSNLSSDCVSPEPLIYSNVDIPIESDEVVFLAETNNTGRKGPNYPPHLSSSPRVCNICKTIWDDSVLGAIFMGSESVTVNSKITYGAIILFNRYSEIHFPIEKEEKVRCVLNRAGLGENIGSLNISEVNNWIGNLMNNKKIKCCDVFDAVYKPHVANTILSTMASGASSKPENIKIVTCMTPKDYKLAPEDKSPLEAPGGKDDVSVLCERKSLQGKDVPSVSSNIVIVSAQGVSWGPGAQKRTPTTPSSTSSNIVRVTASNQATPSIKYTTNKLNQKNIMSNISRVKTKICHVENVKPKATSRLVVASNQDVPVLTIDKGQLKCYRRCTKTNESVPAEKILYSPSDYPEIHAQTSGIAGSTNPATEKMRSQVSAVPLERGCKLVNKYKESPRVINKMSPEQTGYHQTKYKTCNTPPVTSGNTFSPSGLIKDGYASHNFQCLDNSSGTSRVEVSSFTPGLEHNDIPENIGKVHNQSKMSDSPLRYRVSKSPSSTPGHRNFVSEDLFIESPLTNSKDLIIPTSKIKDVDLFTTESEWNISGTPMSNSVDITTYQDIHVVTTQPQDSLPKTKAIDTFVPTVISEDMYITTNNAEGIVVPTVISEDIYITSSAEVAAVPTVISEGMNIPTSSNIDITAIPTVVSGDMNITTSSNVEVTAVPTVISEDIYITTNNAEISMVPTIVSEEICVTTSNTEVTTVPTAISEDIDVPKTTNAYVPVLPTAKSNDSDISTVKSKLTGEPNDITLTKSSIIPSATSQPNENSFPISYKSETIESPTVKPRLSDSSPSKSEDSDSAVSIKNNSDLPSTSYIIDFDTAELNVTDLTTTKPKNSGSTTSKQTNSDSGATSEVSDIPTNNLDISESTTANPKDNDSIPAISIESESAEAKPKDSDLTIAKPKHNDSATAELKVTDSPTAQPIYNESTTANPKDSDITTVNSKARDLSPDKSIDIESITVNPEDGDLTTAKSDSESATAISKVTDLTIANPNDSDSTTTNPKNSDLPSTKSIDSEAATTKSKDSDSPTVKPIFTDSTTVKPKDSDITSANSKARDSSPDKSIDNESITVNPEDGDLTTAKSDSESATAISKVTDLTIANPNDSDSTTTNLNDSDSPSTKFINSESATTKSRDSDSTTTYSKECESSTSKSINIELATARLRDNDSAISQPKVSDSSTNLEASDLMKQEFIDSATTKSSDSDSFEQNISDLPVTDKIIESSTNQSKITDSPTAKSADSNTANNKSKDSDSTSTKYKDSDLSECKDRDSMKENISDPTKCEDSDSTSKPKVEEKVIDSTTKSEDSDSTTRSKDSGSITKSNDSESLEEKISDSTIKTKVEGNVSSSINFKDNDSKEERVSDSKTKSKDSDSIEEEVNDSTNKSKDSDSTTTTTKSKDIDSSTRSIDRDSVEEKVNESTKSEDSDSTNKSEVEEKVIDSSNSKDSDSVEEKVNESTTKFEDSDSETKSKDSDSETKSKDSDSTTAESEDSDSTQSKDSDSVEEKISDSTTKSKDSDSTTAKTKITDSATTKTNDYHRSHTSKVTDITTNNSNASDVSPNTTPNDSDSPSTSKIMTLPKVKSKVSKLSTGKPRISKFAKKKCRIGDLPTKKLEISDMSAAEPTGSIFPLSTSEGCISPVSISDGSDIYPMDSKLCDQTSTASDNSDSTSTVSEESDTLSSKLKASDPSEIKSYVTHISLAESKIQSSKDSESSDTTTKESKVSEISAGVDVTTPATPSDTDDTDLSMTEEESLAFPTPKSNNNDLQLTTACITTPVAKTKASARRKPVVSLDSEVQVANMLSRTSQRLREKQPLHPSPPKAAIGYGDASHRKLKSHRRAATQNSLSRKRKKSDTEDEDEEEEEYTHNTKRERSGITLCAALGLNTFTLESYFKGIDSQSMNNETAARMLSEQLKHSPAYNAMVSEQSALIGFAREAFNLLPFERNNCHIAELCSGVEPERYLTNRELLALQGICIHHPESPDVDLFYQILVQILIVRNRVLLVPNSLSLLLVAEKLRRDFNRSKRRGNSAEFLAQEWDVNNLYTTEDLQLIKKNPPKEPTVRHVLSVFCLWKTLEKQSPNLTPNMPLPEALEELCRDIDLSNVDKTGLCVRLYAKFCHFLYDEKDNNLAEYFLNQRFIGPNTPSSKKALMRAMQPHTQQRLKAHDSLSSQCLSKVEEEVTKAIQVCTEAEKVALHSSDPVKELEFQQSVSKLKECIEKYRELKERILKKSQYAERKKEEILSNINEPKFKKIVSELHTTLTTLYQKLSEQHANNITDPDTNATNRKQPYPKPSLSTRGRSRGRKRKLHGRVVDRNMSSGSRQVSSCGEEVDRNMRELVRELLEKDVEAEQVRPIILALTPTSSLERLTLPSNTWIRNFARLNGFKVKVV
ncbi:hypothetical protein Pcinc_021914 [Petrolisthes cinctipes]|uniref:Uncharacterized protein n=1 Tax=Petrolisthes cinctipes TaxID=88211 RepID=A0AAE1FEN4_PETCI|nr:hypothetical protein Pcinc_021914 [Petrolisthes cinctipes]